MTIVPQPNPQAAKRVSADRGQLLRTLRNLWPFIWPADRADLKMRVVWALVALILAKIVTVFVPFFYKWATDALVAATGSQAAAGMIATASVPIMFVVAYGVGRVLMSFFNQLRDIVFARVSVNAERELGVKAFVHLHGLSLRYHLSRRTGGLSRIMARGVGGLASVVHAVLMNSVPTVIEFLFSATIILLHFGPLYLAVVAATVVLYIAYTVRVADARLAIQRLENELDRDAHTKAIDSLINYETVKYFGNERLETDRFNSVMRQYEDAAVKSATTLAGLNFGQAAIFTVGMTVCMGLSAMAIVRGEQTLGDFVLINALLAQLAVPLNFAGMIYREIRRGLGDLEELFGVLDLDPEIVDQPGARPLAIGAGTVRFENVDFRYDPDRTVMSNVSFEVPAGHTVAIVGPSGAGKSTIARLLFRFYDVSGGRILIDGQDIREVTQDSLRRAIGMVPQDTVLFNDTIAYNIRYGRNEASQDEVRAAAETAQIGRFIESLPKGYDTEVGERGLKLSGGEKQRVAIARTVLKAPPILIFDEATSALDTRTEREIQKALDRVASGRTTLIVAHRLSTIIHADQILVLDAGRVVERGTHARLLADKGLYASMWNRQQEAAEAAERLRRAEEAELAIGDAAPVAAK